MRYLGIAKSEKGYVKMPDSFKDPEVDVEYEAIEIGGDVLLIESPFERERLARIEKLARLSINEHRKTLEGLAR